MKGMDELEYLEWLEDVVREIVEGRPRAISVEMVMEDNTASTRYYNVTSFDRALMMATMQEAQIMDLIADNREAILELLNGDDDEEGSE